MVGLMLKLEHPNLSWHFIIAFIILTVARGLRKGCGLVTLPVLVMLPAWRRQGEPPTVAAATGDSGSSTGGAGSDTRKDAAATKLTMHAKLELPATVELDGICCAGILAMVYRA